MENDAWHWGTVEELDARLLSPCRGGWSIHLSEVLFHCSTALYWLVSTSISWLLLIQIATQRMIFPFFFLIKLTGFFLQCSTGPFLPCVELQFCEFICCIHRSHIWYFLTHVTQNTLNSDFFPTFFSLWHLQFLYYFSTLAAFGTLDLNSAPEIFASNTSTSFSLYNT